MKGIEHLTKNQIAGYRAGRFDARESREIGRHLLKCESCRKSLPALTLEDFWNAVMNEREPEQTSDSEKSEFSRHSIFSAFPKIFGQFGDIAWRGAALIVLVSFSLLLWLNVGRQWDQETDVAQTFNSEITDFNPAQFESGEQIFPAPAPNSRIDKQVSSSDSTRPEKLKSPKAKVQQNNLSLSSEKDGSRNSARQIPNDKADNISATRGVTPAKCGDETTIETEVERSGETITLKWKKIPNAAKYHLYISDDEEILIDEFETEGETSFLLKRSLDPLKTYQWKIIVTLENGKTIAGPSNKFTVRDFQNNQPKPQRKKVSDIRCSAQK